MQVNRYFWRTLAQQEVDYVEEGNGIAAYECKWNPKASGKFSLAFINQFKKAKTFIVHPDNAEKFLI